MSGVIENARRLAGMGGAPILVQGERGSGLLELARFIHEEDVSSRSGQFRAIASRFVGQPTPFARARAGTLFIEDVEGLTAEGQEWLASWLSQATGERRFRIIAASQLSVGQLLESSTLSQELILMLDVGRIVVPPLRDRPGDVMELAGRFLARCAAAQRRPGLRFSAEAEVELRRYAYPGNVRELLNVVERAAALEPSDEIQRSSVVFHEELQDHGTTRRVAAQSTARRLVEDSDRRRNRLPTFSELEREYLVMLIRELRGRRADMSRVMGVSYPTVRKKLARHGLAVRSILEAEAP
jgi:DNA-binding NtrC family response regulator